MRGKKPFGKGFFPRTPNFPNFSNGGIPDRQALPHKWGVQGAWPPVRRRHIKPLQLWDSLDFTYPSAFTASVNSRTSSSVVSKLVIQRTSCSTGSHS